MMEMREKRKGRIKNKGDFGPNCNVNYDKILKRVNFIKSQDKQRFSSDSTEEHHSINEFNQLLQSILPCNGNDEKSKGMPSEDSQQTILQNKVLQKLLHVSTKLKSLEAINCVSSESLMMLLTLLEKNISNRMNTSLLVEPRKQTNEEKRRKIQSQQVDDTFLEAVNAAIIVLNILTSHNLPINLYLDDVIDRVIILVELLLKKYIYPFCNELNEKTSKMKGSFNSDENVSCYKNTVKNKFVTIYNRLVQVIHLLSELLIVHHLTDNTILQMTNIAISPFAVENINEVKLEAIKLAVNVFAQYEMHRMNILNGILDLTDQLSESNINQKSFWVNTTDHIHLISALILQVVQNSVLLSEISPSTQKEKRSIQFIKEKKPLKHKETEFQIWDSTISSKYNTVLRAAAYLLQGFLNKCSVNRSPGSNDQKLLLEAFIQDLLTVHLKPEWPVAELFMNLLSKFLISNIQNKNADMTLRCMSLDLLCPITTKLKKEAMYSPQNFDAIIQSIDKIKSENCKKSETETCKKRSKLDKDEHNETPQSNYQVDDQVLQGLLLDYLHEKERNGQSTISTRYFYIVKWYKDISMINSSLPKEENKSSTQEIKEVNHKTKNKIGLTSKLKSKKSMMEDDDSEHEECKINSKSNRPKHLQFIQLHKLFLINKINYDDENLMNFEDLTAYVDTDTAELITRHLTSKVDLLKNVHIHLQHILCILMENVSTIRAKAMKCLTSVIDVDPSLLERTDIQNAVSYSFLDHSISVREAAVSLVGKYVLNKIDIFAQYYDKLSTRILDTGISVRKQVIKIFRDIYMKYPHFPKIPEMCVKIIRRVNDQDTVQKIVISAFQEMWFTPYYSKNSSSVLINKVTTIIKAVASLNSSEMVLFENLLMSYCKLKENDNLIGEPSKSFLEACKEIVNCIIQCALFTEEVSSSLGDGELSEPHHKLACFTTLNLFANAFPSLLVEHVSTLQPYLCIKCNIQGDLLIVQHVAQTLQHVIPLVKHPSQVFLAKLEEDLLKVILQNHIYVVESAISCLSVVSEITKNYKLIQDLFKKFYNLVTRYKQLSEKDLCNNVLVTHRPLIRRSIYVLGLLIRNFDFKNKEVKAGLDEKIIDKSFEILMFFLESTQEDLKLYSLKALGSLSVRHGEFMLNEELNKILKYFLTCEDVSFSLKNQVLNNLYIFLKEEEKSIIKEGNSSIETQNHKNLKEMGNISQETMSTVAQLYCGSVVELCISSNVTIRRNVLKFVEIVIQQGLMQPFHMIPYLISMTSDEEEAIRNISQKLLEDTERKQPGLMHIKFLQGVHLSYKLQIMIQNNKYNSRFIRGFRAKQNEIPEAMHAFLYTIVQSSIKSRRALITNLLKCFEGHDTSINLPQLLFIADNLAYFPYLLLDELLFVLQCIDVTFLACGTYVTDHLKEIDDSKTTELSLNSETLVKINRNEKKCFLQIPQETNTLQVCIATLQRCILLIDLKQHLKNLYAITDGKMLHYSLGKQKKISERVTKLCGTKLFTPTITIQYLCIETDVLTCEQKEMLIEHYLMFKEEFFVDES